MSYALVQTTHARPPVEALERAFASGRGLTPADARFVADDAFGFLARDLELDDALFLQQSLGAEGIEVQVVPESDLPQMPEAKLFRFTLKHSILLASVLGLIVVFYAYVMTEWVR